MEDISSDSDDSYGDQENAMTSSRVTEASDTSEGASSNAVPTPRMRHRHSIYYHHPERRRQTLTGVSPQQ